MGVCAYCGKSAGFLRSSHRDCREAHDRAVSGIADRVAGAGLRASEADGLMTEIDAAAKRGRLDAAALRKAIVAGWERAVEHAFADGVLSADEEQALSGLAKRFNLSGEELDGNGAWTRLVEGAVLRDVLDGNVPERMDVAGRLPFNFQKSERLVWLFENTEYLEDKTRTHYRGGSQGVSIRIARGLYYRTGGFRGERIQTTETVSVDTGLLGATTKHLYFSGPKTGFRIRYDRIVAFEPYSDGIGVQREAASAKPQKFLTGDGWFVYNLVTNLARL